MALNIWLIYLTAVTGLALTPGPNGLLALTHGALYGHRRTLWTISGGVLGFVLLMALSMFGIGALLQASAQALVILKWAGGAYLVYLGVQLWRTPGVRIGHSYQAPPRTRTALLRQGLFSALSNPKVILFFGAFLPQFLDPKGDIWLQFVVMALTFAFVEGLVEWVLARLAHRIRPWLVHSGGTFNRCCGTLFAVLGVALPLTR